jgi:putative transposase
MCIVHGSTNCPIGWLVYHLVWAPMRHRPVLVGAAAGRLRELLEEKAEQMGVTLRVVEIQPDRVYLAVDAPPTVSPHQIVCGFKGHSSAPLRQEFKHLTAIPTLWTRSYVVAAGETVDATHVLALFEATMPPRRPRGRPAKRGDQR